jgi:hypothetical protein
LESSRNRTFMSESTSDVFLTNFGVSAAL